MSWKNLRNWIIENHAEKPDAKVEDLVWLKKTIKPGEKINWSFVDTVEYNIDSIPKKRMFVFEFMGKPVEVEEKWKNYLLSLKKAHLSRTEKNMIMS